ncbi:DUF4130 domain-containing protein [Pontiella agarivorans]|uniref:DUF4130 domain-containing protein n=1 Tax=Pontiella agarivorans TaxID=3038953 RepID=A0ABU5MXY6_9BACT|nr:DUF4130 domain-containing protein [Pontiella agarivorans]MDZ8119025.1 DUF4130 domain-containing protein [Pontiella agarivorans]
MGLKLGRQVDRLHADTVEHAVHQAARNAGREIHRFKGLLRCRKLVDGLYWAPFEPERLLKNNPVADDGEGVQQLWKTFFKSVTIGETRNSRPVACRCAIGNGCRRSNEKGRYSFSASAVPASSSV